MIILLSSVLFSCVPSKEIRRPAVVTPAMLLQRTNLKGIDAFRASVYIKAYEEDDYLGVYPGFLVFKRPDMLKLSMNGPFGIVLMEIVFLRGDLLLYMPSKDLAYKGTLSFKKLLFTDEELLALDHRMEKRNSEYLLLFYKKARKDPLVIYRFDTEHLSWRGFDLYNRGKRVLKVTINRLEGNLPVDFNVKTGRYSLHISLSDTEINPSLKEGLFRLPDSSKVRPLGLFRGWL